MVETVELLFVVEMSCFGGLISPALVQALTKKAEFPKKTGISFWEQVQEKIRTDSERERMSLAELNSTHNSVCHPEIKVYILNDYVMLIKAVNAG